MVLAWPELEAFCKATFGRNCKVDNIGAATWMDKYPFCFLAKVQVPSIDAAKRETLKQVAPAIPALFTEIKRWVVESGNKYASTPDSVINIKGKKRPLFTEVPSFALVDAPAGLGLVLTVNKQP